MLSVCSLVLCTYCVMHLGLIDEAYYAITDSFHAGLFRDRYDQCYGIEGGTILSLFTGLTIAIRLLLAPYFTQLYMYNVG